MKLYTFVADGQPRIGVALKEQIIDLSAAAGVMRVPRRLPADMLSFLRMGEAGLNAAREVLAFMQKRPPLPVGVQVTHLLETVRVLAPIPRPPKILCAENNYRSNTSTKSPSKPLFASRVPTTVIGPGEPIVYPRLAQQVDFGVQLAIVVGRETKRIPSAQAMDCIAGYTILNDVSARDVQCLHNNFDTFCPIGPCIVSRDEFPDPVTVRLRSSLNGKLMQDDTTANWSFPLPDLLSCLSQFMTLEPGDIVSTGTPEAWQPEVFLKPNDLVRSEIEGIGALENPVVCES